MNLANSLWSQEKIKVLSNMPKEYGKFFERCYLITNLKSDDKHIIKIVWKTQMRQSERGWKKVMNERLIWQKLSIQSYILDLHGFFETPACYCFVIRHIPDSCTLSYLIENAPLPIEAIRLISAQIAIAIHQCHSNGILIRDLSSESFLIHNTGKINLCNLESAKVTKLSCNRYGQLDYRSPEVIQRLKYDKSSDWFSLGIIIYEMLIGKTPLRIFCEKKNAVEDDLPTDFLLRG
jgi:protein kinase C-like 3